MSLLRQIPHPGVSTTKVVQAPFFSSVSAEYSNLFTENSQYSLFFMTFYMVVARLKLSEHRKPTQMYGIIKKYPSRISCNFENGWCRKWQRNTTSLVQWNLNQGPTRSIKSGPDVDHTLQNSNGHYAYVNDTTNPFENTAFLYSPQMLMLEDPLYCLSFWYHMKGRGVGSLQVIWKFPSTRQNVTGFEYLIFSKNGPTSFTGSDWKEARITLFSPLGLRFISSVYFEFRATKGIFPFREIAVDDISVRPGACHGYVADIYRFTPRPGSRPRNNNLTGVQLAISWLRPEYRQFCGEIPYSSETHTCCEGNLREGVGTCCGDNLMTLSVQRCCGRTVYWPGKQLCCNETVYNQLFKGCCSGRIYYKSFGRCVNGLVI